MMCPHCNYLDTKEDDLIDYQAGEHGGFYMLDWAAKRNFHKTGS